MSNPSHSIDASIVKQWDVMKRRLPGSVLNRIGSNVPPLGITASDWKHFITMGLRFGRMGENGNVSDWLYDKLMLLSSNSAVDDQNFLTGPQETGRYFAVQPSQAEQDAEGRVRTDVGCTEIASLIR